MRWDLYTCIIVEFFQSPISTNASHCVKHSIWWLFMINCAAVLCSPHWLDMLKGFHSFEWWFAPVSSVCHIFKRPARSIYLKSWTCYQHGYTNSWDITTFKVICISHNNCSSTSFATNFVSVAVSTHKMCSGVPWGADQPIQNDQFLTVVRQLPTLLPHHLTQIWYLPHSFISTNNLWSSAHILTIWECPWPSRVNKCTPWLNSIEAHADCLFTFLSIPCQWTSVLSSYLPAAA